VDEDDEDVTSSGSSSEEEDSGSYDDTPPQRDKRPCDAKGQHYVLQQESLNDPQENVDDDESAVKHVSLQLLDVFGESLSLMHTNHFYFLAHGLLLSLEAKMEQWICGVRILKPTAILFLLQRHCCA